MLSVYLGFFGVNKCIWVIVGFFSLDVVCILVLMCFILWFCCGGVFLMNFYLFGIFLFFFVVCLYYVFCCVMNVILCFEI